MKRYFIAFLTGLFFTLFVSCSPLLPAKSFNSNTLSKEVLSIAIKARQNAAKKGIKSKSVMAIIDYRLPSDHKRLWIIDTQHRKILHHTYVAHGKNSGYRTVNSHSNQHGSYKTSIGLFRTGKVYKGKHGDSLELHGLERGVNHNAFSRRVVMHGSDYVGEHYAKRYGRQGRSLGCPAISRHEAPQLIQMLKDGALLLAYYPDKQWLKTSEFL